MPLKLLSEHSLSASLVTRLRDTETPPARFREITRTLTQLLMAEATRELVTCPIQVRTPLEVCAGRTLSEQIVLVPVLRAGLGMLEAAQEMVPEATVGFVGLERNEATAKASSYYCKLPPLTNSNVFLLDPMLATGGSAASAIRRLQEAGANRITLLCIVAAPEGVARLQTDLPSVDIVAAALDRELNQQSYILPGLGDFGDRLFGTT